MAKGRLKRKLAVILHADVVGSTAHVQQNETLAHERIHAVFNRFSETIKSYGGVTHELRGDALVAEFERASDAVTASIAFQDANSIRNLELGDDLRPILRIGVAMGEVVIADSTVTGEGVVLAQRLEQLAEPGGLCISGAVHETMPQHLPFHQDDLGEQELKGFDEPVRVYRVRLKDGESLSKLDIQTKNKSITQVAAIGIILVLLGGIGLLAWNQFGAPDFEPLDPDAMVQPLPEKPSIAVLAFDDLSTAKDQGYLSDAISEGVITELARFSELFVIARNSSFQYRDKATDTRDIAAELGVHYVLEGSQQKEGNSLRITVQLIDALAGTHIWVETYDRKLEDLFAVQDEIVRSVASAVGRKITVRPPPSGGLSRLSALHHKLKASQSMRQFTKEGTEKALLENLAAIEADPTSPFGYTGLTHVYNRMADWGIGDIDPEEALKLARESAEKALELEPNNYEAHHAMASVHQQEGELDLAIARYEKAIELNPSATGVTTSLSQALVYSGRATEAIELLHRAMRLDPHYEWVKWDLAWALWTNGDCDQALSALLSMAKLPNMARRSLAVIYVCLGRQEEAEATITKFLETKPEYTVSSFRDSYQHRYINPDDVEPFLDGLRKAGLPE
jgi:TolB-like protein/class 3 adenylate cyclase